MALAQLIERMSGAMRQIAVDNQVLFNVCVDDIAVALRQADVHSNLVRNMRNNVSKWITVDDNRYIKQVRIHQFHALKSINLSFYSVPNAQLTACLYITRITALIN